MRKKRKQCGLIQPKIMKLNISTLNLIKNRLNLQELTYTCNDITNMKTSITYLNFFINICKMDTNLNIIYYANKRPNSIWMHKVG